jgi:hypothetical protein
MPPYLLAAPVALPVLGSLIAVVYERLRWPSPRLPVAACMWAATAALLALWIPIRSSQVAAVASLGFANFHLRLDAVGLAFALIVLVPAALLLSLQRRTCDELAIASLAVAAALLGIESRGVVLTALAGSMAGTFVVIGLGMEDAAAPRPSWAILLAAWLGVAWAGVILQVQGGTAEYDALPVAALTIPVVVLLGASAVLASGLYPWRGWATGIWMRPTLRGAGIAALTLQPLGLYVLVRAYEMGDGRYPQSLVNLALMAWGLVVALGAALRAQAAETRRDYLAEILPGMAGFTLMSLAVGSTLGVVAAFVLLAATATVAACLPLLPGRRTVAPMLLIASAAGVPPSLAFGGRLLGLDAAFEAGGATGLAGVAGVATWLLSVAGAARSVGLPIGDAHSRQEASPRVAVALSAAALAAGPALGVIALLAGFAAADVMSPPAVTGAGGGLSVATVSTVLAAVALLGPLLVLGLVAVAVSRPARPAALREKSRSPMFEIPGQKWLAPAWAQLRAATIPEQYRSMFNPRALETVVAGGSSLLWLASLVALAFAVTR